MMKRDQYSTLIDQAHTIRKVYAQADGSVSVASDMDLLPVHEVGHVFVDQTTDTCDFHLPRRWLIELFCNLCLHAYDAGGIESVKAMFGTVVQANDSTSDEHLAMQLRESVHPNAARVLTTWPDLKLSEQ
jgi:hypothetical protein